MTIQEQITATAAAYGVDPTLALNVASAESGFNPSAVSSKGAIGIFQLMPATAAQLGVDPSTVAGNIQGGIRYLASLISQYGGDAAKALAAYNWGPGNVARAGDSWASSLPAATQSYVTSILGADALSTPAAGADSLAIDASSPDAVIADGMSSGIMWAALATGAVILWLYWRG